MHSRARGILPALLLASVLPLSLSACAGEPGAGEPGGDGAGRSGLRQCDGRSYLVLAVAGGLEEIGTGSSAKSAKYLGSAPCSPPKSVNFLLVGEDAADARQGPGR